jgi:BirA family transcriptional regulator, biotin operon repressor / biotin---[acetyl-CoA-carboxylase] ligase
MEGPFARVVHVERTASTNDDAAALLGDDAALGTTIVAEEQTHGAGRKGRSWIATPGSALLFTTILPREIDAAALWSVPFWTALAVSDALDRCGVGVTLQWPNDLLLGSKKLAGILCTSRVFGNRARVGCGVGINVYRTPDADERIDPPPAFCSDVARVDREQLLSTTLACFARRLPLLDDVAATARAWEREAGVPGQRYRIQVDGEAHAFDAVAVALAPGGALVVECDGTRRSISLADARVLR